jgi:hypothetical protein
LIGGLLLDAELLRREMAETTLREGMAEKQRRWEQTERERADLCQELEAIHCGARIASDRRGAG